MVFWDGGACLTPVGCGEGGCCPGLSCSLHPIAFSSKSVQKEQLHVSSILELHSCFPGKGKGLKPHQEPPPGGGSSQKQDGNRGAAHTHAKEGWDMPMRQGAAG